MQILMAVPKVALSLHNLRSFSFSLHLEYFQHKYLKRIIWRITQWRSLHLTFPNFCLETKRSEPMLVAQCAWEALLLYSISAYRNERAPVKSILRYLTGTEHSLFSNRSVELWEHSINRNTSACTSEALTPEIRHNKWGSVGQWH